MNKYFILSGILVILIMNVAAQDDAPNKKLKSGIWVKAAYAAPFGNFMYANGQSHITNAANFGVNLQFGATIYLGPRIANKLRFGIDACAVDFSYFSINPNYFNSNPNYFPFDGSDSHKDMVIFINFLEIGPKISFSPNKNFAIDLYCRMVPGISLLNFETNATTEPVTINYLGLQLNSLLGIAFRVKAFEIGCEYKTGRTSYGSSYSDTYGNAINTTALNTANLRILIGVRF
jgi:hypothetical protein